MKRPDRARAIARVLTVASIVLAACVAAALAHVGIDVVGDFVLSHDAYDGIAHDSRTMTLGFASALLVAFGACALWTAWLDARGDGASVRAALARDAGRAPWAFVSAVVLVTPCVLIAMEAIDTVLRDGRFDDISDLLGGSIALALAVTIPIAVAVACIVRVSLATMFRSCRALVAAMDSFLRRVLRDAASSRCGDARRRIAPATARSCRFSAQASRRGPPFLSGVRRYDTAF